MAFAATASKRGAFADMNKAAIDVAQALARLSELTIFELRGEWRRLHRMPPPMRLSRDLLVRGITYKLQERAYGGLSTATARKLEQAGADSLSRGSVTPAPPISLRPGTRLVREWRGSPIWSSSMPTGSSGAASATVPSPWSRERSRAPAGRARDSLASGSGRWSLLQPRDQAMARADPARAGLPVRCAIYTRKSSDEGLEEEFSILSTLSGRRARPIS
jgi:hypothetical protein